MKNISVKKYENRESLINDLNDEIIQSLNNGVSENNKASMLLSGGTTPGPLYEKLSKETLDWDKVWFAPTDERWVAPDHDDSNEKLIRNMLLQNNASSANYVGLKSSPDNPRDGQPKTENKLATFPAPIDVVLIGMGTDGHMASLFPGVHDTIVAMDEGNANRCAPIVRGNGEVDRISMTLNCILNSKQVILFFYGDEKLKVFEKASLGKTDELPVSYLLNQDKVPVTLYWAE
ncbi:6-phosphogluconolactonase [Pseudemcibacter aquimaris]|uniref:6-phosphogluconolactonase n=1 Tax=Pseudemcibacter aquimaris TaxID=2857064 RepID=UPI0020110597|nr:6-phosphogluconolactonase [Pseudemcibacter aquimaris]MCC3860363.1 6-phosphogluconolactonase [Pseudemcibacter aquimaris]WDU57689.1 6-phosphogluconolactonase [Pseudemcibacter aquimaris]